MSTAQQRVSSESAGNISCLFELVKRATSTFVGNVFCSLDLRVNLSESLGNVLLACQSQHGVSCLVKKLSESAWRVSFSSKNSHCLVFLRTFSIDFIFNFAKCYDYC
jgi:hypothetical protein